MRVKCLAQEHNTISPVRVQTRTAISGIKRTNHEVTMPSSSRKLMQITNFYTNRETRTVRCNRFEFTYLPFMNPCVPYVKQCRNSLKLFAVMTRPVRGKHYKLAGLMQTNKKFILRRLSCDYIEVNVTNSRTIELQARPLLVLILIITSVKTGSDYQTRERHYK